MRFVMSLCLSLILTACASSGVQSDAANPPVACGPSVTGNQVRIIKLLDEYASLGREATLDIAEERVGKFVLLDKSEAIAYWYSSLERKATEMGCDVIIHVRTSTVRGGDERYHVFLARREGGA